MILPGYGMHNAGNLKWTFAIASGIFVLLLLFSALITNWRDANQNKLNIYMVDRHCRLFTGYFDVGPPGNPQPTMPQSDRTAARLILDDLRKAGVRLKEPELSYALNRPNSYAGENVILVCGPHGNSMSYELNTHIAADKLRAFFFEQDSIEDRRHTPQGHERWSIRCGAMPDLRARVEDGQGSETGLDYGLAYIGKGPRSDCWVIWVAGLGAPGTIGAAKAIIDPHNQALISTILKKNRFASLLVTYKYRRENNGEVGDVVSLVLLG